MGRYTLHMKHKREHKIHVILFYLHYTNSIYSMVYLIYSKKGKQKNSMGGARIMKAAGEGRQTHTAGLLQYPLGR